jgi:siroheme synthase-like protein
MADLPIMLRLEGRRAVIVGGGAVARRRAASLVEAGASVTVIAPRVDPAIEKLPLHVERRVYRAGDLDGVMLVVVATDDPAVNAAVAGEAAAKRVLVNRTDRPESGDVQVPAHRRVGPITVAVHSGGASARAAARIRDELFAGLDGDWAVLLETIEPYRRRARVEIADASRRQAALLKLADEQAMAALKSGGVEALRQHCERTLSQPNHE